MAIRMHRRIVVWGLALGLGLMPVLPGGAQARDFSILWWSTLVHDPQNNESDRRVLARFLDQVPGYDTTFRYTRKRGALAAHLGAATARYDLIVLDSGITRNVFDRADIAALRKFYASSGRALMLDGSLVIRNARYEARTRFPGDNEALAGLLLNQVEALRRAGGGVLIGTDHDTFQVGANQALGAILPGVQFTGVTNPSTDGEFNGKLLLSGKSRIRPIDILRHWEVIPNQGEAPVGRFQDFLGNEVVLHSLVDISDKPGGKRKRSYISFTSKPGDEVFDVDSEEAPEQLRYMPTRKSVVDE